MIAICPDCGFRGTVTAFINDEDARKAVDNIAELSSDPLPKLALRYITLFQVPGANRSASWSKGSRLIKELTAMIKAGHVAWKGKPARQTTPKMWADAIAVMLDRRERKQLELPMDNHNYLISIVYDAADKSDRKTEVARNKSENTGTYRQNTEAVPDIVRADPAFMKMVRGEKFPKRVKSEMTPISEIVPTSVKTEETPSDAKVREFVESWISSGAPLHEIRVKIEKMRNIEYLGAFERLYECRNEAGESQ